jgi:hypothetical protein
MSSGSDRLARWQCALAGGIAATVAAPLFPISLAIGGGLAGYLRRGDTREGVLIGAAAGLCSAAVVIGLALFATTVLGVTLPAVPGGGAGTEVRLWFGVMVFVFLPSVFAILSAVGGALGVHVLESPESQQADPAP